MPYPVYLALPCLRGFHLHLPFMEPLTDRIAGALTPESVVLAAAVLTAVRVLTRLWRSATGRLLSEAAESILVALVVVFLLVRPFGAQTFYIPSGSMHPTLWEGDRIVVNKWAYRNASPERGDVIVFRAPPEASPKQDDYIKRVIGLPGDVIEVREGFVQVGDIVFVRSDIRAQLGAGQSVDRAGEEALSGPPLRLTTKAIYLGARRVSPAEFARLAGQPGARTRIVPGRVLRNNVVLCENYVAEDPGYHWGPQVVAPHAVLVFGDNRNASHDGHVWGMLPQNRVIGRADLIFWPPKNAGRVAKDWLDQGCGGGGNGSDK